MTGNPAQSNTEIYKFFNSELKELYGEISQINERLAILETRGETHQIDTNSIMMLNTKLDTLNSRISDNSAIKNKPNWVQVGKVIGLVITGIVAILGSYFAGTQ